jgi:hypothetical protein
MQELHLAGKLSLEGGCWKNKKSSHSRHIIATVTKMHNQRGWERDTTIAFLKEMNKSL